MRANSFATNLNKKLGKQRVFYVCRDLERAIFSEKLPKKFFIITNRSDFARQIAAKEKNIFLIPSHEILDTAELLARPETKKLIRAKDFVLVFKNTGTIEKIAHENNWQVINPPAELSNKIEEKISQYHWLGAEKKILPKTSIKILKTVKWENKKFILQFNRAHTGQGTILIENNDQLLSLQKLFPERPVRVSSFIDGPVFTTNLLIWGKKMFFGNPSYQITGIMPFTRSPFATIGNDWALAEKFLTKEKRTNFKDICRRVGRLMLKSGWHGLFGVDIIFSGNRAYLLEINARQPASTGFESLLQEKTIGRKKTDDQISIFEAHLGALIGLKPEYKLIRIKDGAQIVKRYAGSDMDNKQKKKITKELSKCRVIFYPNKKNESDQARIQCFEGIMENHHEFNDFGRRVANLFI